MEHFLSQINTIIDAFQIVKKANGENFNIYKILGISTQEVKTHSRFIAELLNPKGSHGQGDTFLKLFLKQINISEHDFLTEKAKVYVEYYIGQKTDIEGGRIDILIADEKGKNIIIENKVYAYDQPLQMYRYKNFNNNAKLLYLTLSGNTASTNSTGGNLEYISISYRNDIISWLENARKEAVNQPILRESISQYIHLIQYLTNQTSDHKMSQKISEIVLKNEKNFSIFLELNKHKEQVYNDFIKMIFEKIAKDFSLKCENSRNLIFRLYNDKMEVNNISIGYIFNLKDCLVQSFFGIFFIKENNDSENLQSSIVNLKNKFNDYYKSHNLAKTQWRLAYLQSNESWSDDDCLCIYDNLYNKNTEGNDKIKQTIIPQVKDILKIINDIFPGTT